MYDSIVLGSGIVGVSTAYWLARSGHKVLVIDRQQNTGMEASYANGGQIAVSHAEPWATTAAPLKVLKWLLQTDAPLLFRPRADIHQWRWLTSWLLQCSPGKVRHNTAELVRLASYSRRTLQQVRAEHTLDYRHKTRGILHFYRTRDEFDAARKTADFMRQYGCNRIEMNKEQALDLEPALRWIGHDIVGATYTEDDESGDACLYTRELADVCRDMGVEFALDTHIMELTKEGNRVNVRVNGDFGNSCITAQNIITCLGVWSAPMLRPLGIYLNIYPAKGYSVTIPVEHPDCAPQVSLTDDEHKLQYSRLGDELRVAGTAELSGYSRELNARRCDMITEQTRRLFPEIGGFDKARFWTGLRPSTPSNLPYIRKTEFDNLWLNTGHGTLGWTLGCGSGKYLADLICHGEASEFNKYQLARL